jgi:hypothetical protein
VNQLIFNKQRDYPSIINSEYLISIGTTEGGSDIVSSVSTGFHNFFQFEAILSPNTVYYWNGKSETSLLTL